MYYYISQDIILVSYSKIEYFLVECQQTIFQKLINFRALCICTIKFRFWYISRLYYKIMFVNKKPEEKIKPHCNNLKMIFS